METENINNTDETTQVEETNTQVEKLFTQDEVNQIVSTRLAKERNNPKNDDEEKSELMKRVEELEKEKSNYQRVSYLKDNGYPDDLLNKIESDNFDDFKDKADQWVHTFKNWQHEYVKPAQAMKSLESNSLGGLDSAFKNNKHVPRDY